ncbi:MULTISPECIES: sugar ABC transporter ATP-binding protein [Streptacidiphilus]|uniref:Sugar ABC transporter ATP-binding protein n=1 Tax=Streptacidiphilus cavernicola TaxID=3342716 RepID=A0ABV6UIY1_9ACTN|nr:sugar ABC transporter ATP-binding protein [Streptacidiphilus jeojiense]
MTAEHFAGPGGPGAVPRLQVTGVSKTFGSNRALHEVSLEVAAGEIHGLIGQNGCGKSTLTKILTGYHAADPGGSIRVDGQSLRQPVRPLDARAHGVGVVHQSLGLVDDRTVVENLRLGRFRAHGVARHIAWRHEREQARAVLERLGRPLPLQALVGSLSEEERATVAIARALQDTQDGRGVVVFDESTRSLTRAALEAFYAMLDDVVATGTSVLLISHSLEEVLAATDRVTVLRDGRTVESGLRTAELSEADLVHALLGRALDGAGARKPADPDRPVVEIRAVAGKGVQEAGLDIARGEIVGVTGLTGAGHEELPYLLTGVRTAEQGTVSIDGRAVRLAGLDCAGAIEAGIVLVPEGRERQGLALELSVSENLVLPQRGGPGRRALSRLDRSQDRELVAEWVRTLDIKPPRPDLNVGQLSGGNQQKVLLAKWLATRPQLLVLHEPTQAVDVGARHAIAEAIRAAADAGCAVLVAGSDENELAVLCDRVLVFREGRIAEELTDDVPAERIVQAIYRDAVRRPLRRSRVPQQTRRT